MSFGPFLVGEIWGAPSGNKAACYFLPATASLGVMVASAYIGYKSRPYDPEGGTVIALWVSIPLNAFLNAYLYNVVKNPN